MAITGQEGTHEVAAGAGASWTSRGKNRSARSMMLAIRAMVAGRRRAGRDVALRHSPPNSRIPADIARRATTEPDECWYSGQPGQAPGGPITAHRSSAAQYSRASYPGVSSCLTMGAFDPVRRLPRHEPIPPVWRMFCRCSFRVGRVGEIAVCGCRSWWRVGRSGRWYAISQRRAFRALLPDLAHEIGHFEITGGWPGG